MKEFGTPIAHFKLLLKYFNDTPKKFTHLEVSYRIHIMKIHVEYSYCVYI